VSSAPTPEQIADRADELQAAFVGFNLAFPPLLDPKLPLLAVHRDLYGIPPEAPVEIFRNDGTLQSSTTVYQALQRISELRGGGLREDLLAFVAMHGATRLGDDLKRARLQRGDGSPLMEFARHLRNACAHGNRWHFRSREPRQPAALRGRALDRGLHGTKAIYGWLGPGDYVDFLDDLAAELRR
jgi:hypothetical protein